MNLTEGTIRSGNQVGMSRSLSELAKGPARVLLNGYLIDRLFLWKERWLTDRQQRKGLPYLRIEGKGGKIRYLPACPEVVQWIIARHPTKSAV